MGTTAKAGGGTDGPRAEIKLAVAMNGGVSLAVWIGGVAYELARACDSKDSWKAVLGGRTVIADVLAGTSAGGINAAFLALHRSCGADLEPLRGMWLDAAGLEPPPSAPRQERHLLRPPRKMTPSLLDGELFYDRLKTAFSVLLEHAATSLPQPQSPAVDLRLTTTSYEGVQEPLPDDLASHLYELNHRASFHFVNEDHPKGACTLRFSPAEIPLLAARLARAARSTASFPFAFEPSRPALAETTGLVGAVRPDHNLLDGGVLNNLPLDHAIEAIFAMHATEKPERWLVAVVPDPSSESEPAAGGPPAAVGNIVMASLMGIPRNQTVGAFVQDVRAHNATVAARSAARRKLLEIGPDRLKQAAGALYASYQESRRTALAVELAERIDAPGYEEVLAAFPDDLPHLPPAWPAGEACWEAAVLLRHVALLLQLHSESGAPARIREEIHRIRRAASDLSHPCEDPERPGEWQAALTREVEGWPVGPGTSATEVRTARAALRQGLADAATVLVQLVDEWRIVAPPPVLWSLAPDPGADERIRHTEAVEILNRLEVLQGAFSTFQHDPDQEVKLGFLTPRSTAALDPDKERNSAATKLAGEQLGHFGAFLKRSWRANDWMWGRLDAASFLFEVLARTGPAVPEEQKKEVQREIVRKEASFIVAAIGADRVAGAESRQGEALVGTGAGRALKEDATWPEIEAALGLTGDTAAEFLGRCRIGEEDVSTEMWSSLTARVGIRAAATSLSVLRRAGLPMQRSLDNALAPIRGIATIADRYASALRPRQRGVHDAAWVARLATAALAAVGAASLVGVDMGSAAAFIWLALAAALLTLTLIAPITTALTALVVCGLGLATAVPKELRPEDWPEWLVPLNRALAIALITLVLTVAASPRVDRADRFLRRVMGRADATLQALDKVGR